MPAVRLEADPCLAVPGANQEAELVRDFVDARNRGADPEDIAVPKIPGVPNTAADLDPRGPPVVGDLVGLLSAKATLAVDEPLAVAGDELKSHRLQAATVLFDGFARVDKGAAIGCDLVVQIVVVVVIAIVVSRR